MRSKTGIEAGIEEDLISFVVTGNTCNASVDSTRWFIACGGLVVPLPGNWIVNADEAHVNHICASFKGATNGEKNTFGAEGWDMMHRSSMRRSAIIVRTHVAEGLPVHVEFDHTWEGESLNISSSEDKGSCGTVGLQRPRRSTGSLAKFWYIILPYTAAHPIRLERPE